MKRSSAEIFKFNIQFIVNVISLPGKEIDVSPRVFIPERRTSPVCQPLLVSNIKQIEQTHKIRWGDCAAAVQKIDFEA